MDLNPFKIEVGGCIYLWAKKEERHNERHRLFFPFPSAAEVVSSGEDEFSEMQTF